MVKRHGEVNVLHAGVRRIIVGAFAAPGIVDQLVRHHQVARQERFADAAHGRNADDAFNARTLEGPDVGSVGNAMRGVLMMHAVAAQEDNWAAP